MRKMYRFLIIYMLIIVILSIGRVSFASDPIEGSLSIEEVMLVVDRAGNVVGMYPENICIEYLYTYTYGVNESEEVSFKIKEKECGWINPGDGPPATVYIPELDAVLRLYSDISLATSSGSKNFSSGNQTYNLGGISIYLKIKICMRFVKPPDVTGVVNIGEYLYEYAFENSEPVVYYEVLAEKYVDDTYVEDIYLYDEIPLSLDNLFINIYTVLFDVNEIYRAGYEKKGELGFGAMLTPLFNIVVCGNIVGGESVLQSVVSLKQSEVVLTVDSDDEEECAVLENVSLIPGEKTSLMLLMKTGVFSLPVNITRSVEGAIIGLGRATGSAIGSGNMWNFVITVPIYINGYYSSWPIFVAEGVVSTPYGEIYCGVVEADSPGRHLLICNDTLETNTDLTVGDIVSGEYTITVTVHDDLGITHTFTGTVIMGASDPSEITDISWSVYDASMRALFGGVIFVTLLMVISLLKESITSTPLIDIVYLRGVLLTLIVAILLLYVAIPVIYRTFVDILATMSLFRKYVDPIETGEPREVFAHLVGYYERTFEAIEQDYQVRFMGNVDAIIASLSTLILVAAGLLAVALALSTPITPAAGMPLASLGGTILSIVFTYLGLLLMVAPGGAIVLVGVALGRVVILMTTVVVTAVLTIGVFLLCIPSPLSQRLGEDLFAAGILYFMVFPLLGPIAYSLYSYVVETASRSIRESINVGLGPFQLLIPIGPVAEIMIYFVASGAAVLIIIVSLAYILSRTGIATGIGEALSGLVWRG